MDDRRSGIVIGLASALLFGLGAPVSKLLLPNAGPLPLAGLFCNGEIGPIGVRPFLHGFTASLALVVRK